MSARRLAALIALAASSPLLAAETTVPEPVAAVAPEAATAAEPGPEEAPASREVPAAEAAPATEPAPETAPTTAPPPSPAAPQAREVEGTKLLFLRMNLRIKLVEQELLSMSPDRLLEHMEVASDILAQLRSRPLEEPEIARADSMEQYLQFLAESYVQLHTGKAPKKRKPGRK